MRLRRLLARCVLLFGGLGLGCAGSSESAPDPGAPTNAELDAIDRAAEAAAARITAENAGEEMEEIQSEMRGAEEKEGGKEDRNSGGKAGDDDEGNHRGSD